MNALIALLAAEGGERSRDWAALVLRAGLGAMWISHALLKILVFTLPGAAKFFDSVGLPGVLVYPVVAAELLGGAAILLGYRTRLVSALLLPILIVAAWVHWPNGWVFTASGGGWEYPVFLALGPKQGDQPAQQDKWENEHIFDPAFQE